MNRIIKVFINRLAPRPPPPLGRWNLDYCDKKLDHKVNLTNEDHCGTCNSYRLTKMSPNTVQKDTKSDEEYKYLCM